MKVNTSQRLQQLMLERNLKQKDILELSKKFQKELGVTMSKSSLSEYVNGSSSPDQYKLTLLGKTLGVSEAWLMGYNVPMIEPQNIVFGDNNGVNGLNAGSGNNNTYNFNSQDDECRKGYGKNMLDAVAVDQQTQLQIIELFETQLKIQQNMNAKLDEISELLRK